MGTQGRIRLHAPWWRGTSMTISRPEQADETIDLPLEGNGYNYEADEVARCIRAGKLESEVMPLDKFTRFDADSGCETRALELEIPW